MVKKRKKRKRKCTAKQLKNLAKGRAIRKKNLAKKHHNPSKKRKYTTNRRKKAKPISKRRTSKPRQDLTMAKVLTGGTGDVNPQLYSGIVQLLAANTPRTIGFLNPVPKAIFGKQGRATVMEVLKIFVNFDSYEAMVAAITLKDRSMTFTTRDFGAVPVDFEEPSCFAFFHDSCQGAFTALGSFAMFSNDCYTMDLTDNAGHGVLVASDFIFVQANSNNFLAIVEYEFKILYRFKNVSITEYVGIVQSQQ